jgi:hypothetical protein
MRDHDHAAAVRDEDHWSVDRLYCVIDRAHA